METINDRLKVFLDSSNMRSEDLRKRLLVKTKTQVSNWVNGKESFPDRYIISMLRLFPNLDANWFIRGSGTMLIAEHPESNYSEDPTSPYLTQCKNPICIDKIKHLTETIDDLRDYRDFLKEELRRKAEPPENKVAGGVGQSYPKTG